MDCIDKLHTNKTIPHNENVVDKFIDTFVESFSAITASNVIYDVFKEDKQNLTKKNVATQLGMNAIAASIYAAYKSYKVTEQNKNVSSFVEKYKQEQEAKSASLTQHI